MDKIDKSLFDIDPKNFVLSDAEDISSDAVATKKDKISTIGYNIENLTDSAKNSLDFLAGLADPDTCTQPFPPVFQNIWSMVTPAVSKHRDFSRFALGLPRGHGKTIMLKMLILYIILFTKRQFIAVFCAREDLAQNIITDVCDMLSSYNMRATFGNWARHIEVDNKEMKKFHFRGRNIILKPVGITSSVRGLNVKNRRPDVMIFDDVQSRDNAKSPALARDLQQHLLGTIMKAKAPDGCTFLYVGNMYPTLYMDGTAEQYTCILRNLQQNRLWISWITGAILADGKALWEEVQPLQQLLEEFENDLSMGEPEIFYAEVLNDPDVAVSKYFDPTNLKAVPFANTDLPQGKFIMIDPSLGKKNSDQQVVAICSIYDAKPVIQEIKVMQVSAPQLVKEVLLLAMNERIPLICAENVAYQSTLLQWFQEISDQLRIEGIYFRPIAPRGRSKNSRILESFRQLFAGDMYLSKEVRAEYITQATAFDPLVKNNVDDILDTIAYCHDVLREHGHESLLPIEVEEFMARSNSSREEPARIGANFNYESGWNYGYNS